MKPTVRQQSPFGTTLFCDDIRQEIGGKVSYMGVYGNEILFTDPFPQVLPRLCLVISYMERPGESHEPVEVFIEGPDSEEEGPLLQAPLPTDQIRSLPIPNEGLEDPFVMGQMFVTMGPLTIKKEGRLRVLAKRGDEIVRLGSLSARSQPTASSVLN